MMTPATCTPLMFQVMAAKPIRLCSRCGHSLSNSVIYSFITRTAIKYSERRNIWTPGNEKWDRLLNKRSKVTISHTVLNVPSQRTVCMKVIDQEDEEIKPALDAVTADKQTPHHVKIVPGKGPPPEPPVDCCMSGCANCVWIQYAEELKDYFSDDQGHTIAREAIEQIENPGLKMFLKLELGML